MVQERALCPFLHDPKVREKTEVIYEKNSRILIIDDPCSFSDLLRGRGRAHNPAKYSRD